jgi:flavin-dependent dehydrogenase
VEIVATASPRSLLTVAKDDGQSGGTVGDMNEPYDVIVVGARCAGAATARLLAGWGHRVLLLDRTTMPSDTLSTHGLARGGVVQLARWGLLDRLVAEGAPPVRSVSFHTPRGHVERPVKDRAGVNFLLAPRRLRIDHLLVQEAVSAGADLRLGTQVNGVLRDASGRVVGVEARERGGAPFQLHARHVVAADGLRSTLAPVLGAQTRRCFRSRATLFYAYVGGVDWRSFEFHVGPGAFAGAFPTHDGEACVWLSRPDRLYDTVRHASGDRAGAWTRLLTEVAPDLGGRVQQGRITSPVRGCVDPPNYVRQAFGDGWSLVGDAGYHRDPITGHGMTDAFRDAELLADALDDALRGERPETAALAAYESARDQALADTFRLTRELARFPHPDRFVELQVALAEALDREATELASRPVLATSVA